ncbi:MAG: sulfatase-like hydrolase/transferase [Polyangiaceae bacterium]
MLPAKARARARRLRRRLALILLLSPGLLCVGLDFANRGRHILRFDRLHALGYAATSLIVAALWGALLGAASARRGRGRQWAAGVLAVLFAFSIGVQQAFFLRWSVYASFYTSRSSDSLPLTIAGSLPLGRTGTLAWVGVAGVLAVFLVRLGRVAVRPSPRNRRALGILAAGLVVTVFAIPVSYEVSLESSAPAALYFHSLTRHVDARRQPPSEGDPRLVRVQVRSPLEVPRLTATPAVRRNVLFLLQESQRADSACLAGEEPCLRAARESHAALPHRMSFSQMRAAASSTAVAISNLWSGVDPTGSFAELHSAPLLWEYAAAAGYDTAYWTSQNLMFGNARLYVQDLPVRHFVTGSNLAPESDTLTGATDDSVVDHAIRHFGDLREPFFAVVHFSNVHRQRRVDPEKAPFQPYADVSGRHEEGRNHYKNAVYLSDAAMARLIRHVLSTEAGQRTVIVFTSDHGESLSEHDNEIEHSSTVFDEEIHVPAWVSAPQGVLTAAEEASLKGRRDEYLVQYDFAPTVLDLLGIWDAPEIRGFRERMIGAPMTRPERVDRAVPLTNVSWVWEYRLPNWGMLRGNEKVMALSADERYRCFDLDEDPEELDDLGESGCPELAAEARAKFRILPREMPAHMRSRPDIWGFGR